MTGAEAWITTDPSVCRGQATIRGTRIPVSVVLDCLAAGMTTAEIMGQYPTLTEAAGLAAAAYRAELARDEFLPLSTERTAQA
jgi:uncharacterized protein (DUF433 family)